MLAARPFQSKPDAVIRVLRSAERLIVEHGWCQKAQFSGGRFCLKGAIASAGVASPAAHDDALRIVRVVLGIQFGPLSAMYAWNDAIERTAGEVIQTLQTAAERAASIMAPATDEVAA